jgi:hypothetical protein
MLKILSGPKIAWHKFYDRVATSLDVQTLQIIELNQKDFLSSMARQIKPYLEKGLLEWLFS